MGTGRLMGIMAAVAVAASASGGAAQQPEQAPDISDEQARELHEQGRAAFVAGEYETALARWQQAWDLSHRPVLLYNIGTVLDRLRRDREALEVFERFLSLQTESEVVAEVRARVRVLRERLGQEQAPGEPEDAGEATPPSAPSAGYAHDEPDDAGGLLWTWVAGGVALAAGAAAVVLGLSAQRAFDELHDGCGAAGGCSEAEIGDSGVERRALGANVLWGVAGAAALAAIVLALVEGNDGDAEVDVVVGPAALAVRGRL